MIHKLAVVHKSAKVADSATVGPFCLIGENVIIGDSTELKGYVTIGNNTIIGKNNSIFQYASIGYEPIDHTYRKEHFSQVIIGNNNIIRECATIHSGTQKEIGVTSIGNNNLIMCYVHIGHDCKIANNVCLVNGVGLAGHVHVDEFVYMSANVGVHQFTRVGQGCFIASLSSITKDVPPYLMVMPTIAGATPCGINVEGLKRRNFTAEQIKKIKNVYRVIYRQGLIIKESLEIIKDMSKNEVILQPFIDVISSSKRGILR